MEKELDAPEKKPLLEDPLSLEDPEENQKMPEEAGINEETAEDQDNEEDSLTESVSRDLEPKKAFETNLESEEERVEAKHPAEHTLDDLAKEVHIPHLKASRLSSLQEHHPAGAQNYRKKKNRLPLLILAGLTIGVIGVTVFILKGGTVSVSFKQEVASSPTPQPEATPAASEQPSPEPPVVSFDRTKYKLRVLNGTTKVGLASSEADKLKNLGYQIDKTGNAPTQSNKQTVVKVKTQQKELLDQLVLDLAPGFEATSAPSLSDSETVDGEIILGLK